MTVDVPPLWDFSPLMWLMLLGLVMAVVPLTWVCWRYRHQPGQRRIYALTVLTLFLTFDLVLFGAFTRLTDSGLGCPDWPGCYGKTSPLGAYAEISAAQTAMPTGPVTHSKAWVEMVHRYFASALGFLILASAVLAWYEALRQRDQSQNELGSVLAEVQSVAKGSRRSEAMQSFVSPWWATLTFVWVCIQGAFGALTVTMKLFPAIVTLHLLGGLILLALLCQQAVRQGQWLERRSPFAVSIGLRRGIVLVGSLLLCQIVLGGWVSTNYAVLACTTFPMCQGSWWPDMNFLEGFQWWRPLGMLRDGSYISFAGLTAIHYVHRLMAYVVLAGLAWLAWRLWVLPDLRRQARWLAGLSILQLITGLSNVVLGWPLLAAVLHTGGAAAMVVVMVWIWSETRALYQPKGGSVNDEALAASRGSAV